MLRTRMVCLFTILLIIAMQSIGGYLPTLDARVPEKHKWKVGDKPIYQLRAMTGEPFSNQSMKGKYVILHFWASWNEGSTLSLSYLHSIWPDIKDLGIQMLSISLDNDVKLVRKIRANHHVDWPVYFSRSKTAEVLAERFNIVQLPRICIISKTGTLIWIGHPKELDRIFETLIENEDRPIELLKNTEEDLIREMENKNQISDFKLDAKEVLEIQRKIVLVNRAARMEDIDLLMKTLNDIPLKAIYDKSLNDRMVDMAEKVHKFIFGQPDVQKHYIENSEFMERLKSIRSLVGATPATAEEMRDLKNLRKYSTKKHNPEILDRKLKEAQELENTDIVAAYKIYKLISTQARLYPQGREALKRIKRIRTSDRYDPVVNQLLQDMEIQRLMRSARSLIIQSNRPAAIIDLQTIIDLYPKSNSAKDARVLIVSLKREQKHIDRLYKGKDPAIQNKKPLKRGEDGE